MLELTRNISQNKKCHMYKNVKSRSLSRVVTHKKIYSFDYFKNYQIIKNFELQNFMDK